MARTRWFRIATAPAASGIPVSCAVHVRTKGSIEIATCNDPPSTSDAHCPSLRPNRIGIGNASGAVVRARRHAVRRPSAPGIRPSMTSGQPLAWPSLAPGSAERISHLSSAVRLPLRRCRCLTTSMFARPPAIGAVGGARRRSSSRWPRSRLWFRYAPPRCSVASLRRHRRARPRSWAAMPACSRRSRSTERCSGRSTIARRG